METPGTVHHLSEKGPATDSFRDQQGRYLFYDLDPYLESGDQTQDIRVENNAERGGSFEGKIDSHLPLATCSVRYSRSPDPI